MNPDEKECPFCAEIIKEKAKKCKHCGSVLDEQLTQNTQLQAKPTKNDEQFENIFNLANTAAESGNYQEAYNYYNKILEVDPDNYKAWYGKAISAGWQSTLANLRIVETVKGIEIAIEKAPDEGKDNLKILAAANLTSLAIAIHKLALENFMNYLTLYNFYESHIEFSSILEFLVSILDIASNYNPDDKNILENIITLTSQRIVSYWDETKSQLQQSYNDRILLTNEDYKYQEAIYNDAERKILETERKILHIDPHYKATYPTKKTSAGCFIATAIYGSYDSPEVLILRSFRDNFLNKSIFGRLFIKYYYFISPPISHWLKSQEKIKNFMKFLFDKIIIVIKDFMN